MDKGYNPEGYDKDNHIIERLLFSLPEYLIYETNMGGWFAFHLQRILSWMNEIVMEKIPKTRDNLYRKIIEFVTDVISYILSWINYFVEKKENGIKHISSTLHTPTIRLNFTN